MANKTINLTMTRGDTLRFIGTLLPGTGQEFTTPILALKFSAKKKYQDAAVVFEKTLNDTLEIVGQSATTVSYQGEVEPADTATLDLKVKKLFYDLQITEGDGRVTTVVGGTITVLPDVTPP